MTDTQRAIIAVCTLAGLVIGTAVGCVYGVLMSEML